MKRAIGLDLGSKTLGIAQSDLMKIIASPVETYRFNENEYDVALDYVVSFIKANNVDEVVLGLPKHMNGDIGDRALISIEFKEKLESLVSEIKVILWDERLSSVSANKILIKGNVSREKRKKVIDKMAAVVILQGFLDSK